MAWPAAEPESEVGVRYTTHLVSVWKASCRSPVSGETIVCYADTIEDARQAVDLAIVQEAHRAGMTVHRRMTDEEVRS